MTAKWAELKIPDADFDIAALHSALDSRRIERGFSWNAVAKEVSRVRETYDVHPVNASTISGLKNKRWGVEGDGVLQMLLWLDRTPESFVPGHPGATHPDAQLQKVTGARILRFDVPAIYARLDAQRAARSLTQVRHETTDWALKSFGIDHAVTESALHSESKLRRSGKVMPS
jgi:hypothetical protein